MGRLLTTKVSPISSSVYRGFIIIPRTFHVRTSGRWTIDVVISRWGTPRAFSTAETAESEAVANEMCRMLGCRIIDQSGSVSSVRDLVSPEVHHQ